MCDFQTIALLHILSFTNPLASGSEAGTLSMLHIAYCVIAYCTEITFPLFSFSASLLQPTCQHAMSSIAFTRLFNSFHIIVVAIITLSTCNIFHNIVLVVLVKSITVSRFSNHSSLSRASTSLSAYSWFRVNAMEFDIKPNQFFYQN